MSHHIYSTDGLVIASGAFGEAGKRLMVFTRMFGLITVNAQGVRLAKSKLRPHIELFSESRFSVVLGKGGWRLVGAALLSNYFRDLRGNKSKLVVVQRIFSLLRKLLADKEDNSALYDVVSNGLAYLKFSNEIKSISAVETLLVLRILHNLGYVGEDVSLKPFLENHLWSNEVVLGASRELHTMVSAVNRSFKEGLF